MCARMNHHVNDVEGHYLAGAPLKHQYVCPHEPRVNGVPRGHYLAGAPLRHPLLVPTQYHRLTVCTGTIWQVRHQDTHTVRWSHTGTTNDTCATCTTTLMLGTGTMKHGVPTRTTAFTVVRGWVLGKSRPKRCHR